MHLGMLMPLQNRHPDPVGMLMLAHRILIRVMVQNMWGQCLVRFTLLFCYVRKTYQCTCLWKDILWLFQNFL
ncbi:hypothetical protein BDA96_01G222900 [Sorghum bicolor]|nr:hypothetical protein BDA96_01G222900 [Sorghum bicolor]